MDLGRGGGAGQLQPAVRARAAGHLPWPVVVAVAEAVAALPPSRADRWSPPMAPRRAASEVGAGVGGCRGGGDQRMKPLPSPQWDYRYVDLNLLYLRVRHFCFWQKGFPLADVSGVDNVISV